MTEPVTETSTWWVTSASCKGSSHDEDTPNQDAVDHTRVQDATGTDVWVAAVSDGHGGRRYVRSAVGSRLAASTAVAHIADVVRSHTRAGTFEDLLRAEIPSVVQLWRDAVLAHVGTEPFTEAEAARAGAPLVGDPLVAYGATLLVVVVGDDGVGLAQIGDGDALIRTHGFATRPVPGDPRLVAGETTSLCLDTAVSDFRYAALPGSADADLVLLSSDGYANSFADQDWWRAVVGDLAWFLAESGYDEFAHQFPDWLGESAAVGGDDVSAVVIARQPLVVAPSASDLAQVVAPASPPPVPPDVPPRTEAGRPVVPPVGAGLPEPATLHDLVEPASADGEPTARGPLRRRALLLLAVAIVLVAALATAWWATDGFGGGSQAPPPTQSPGDTQPGGHRSQHPSNNHQGHPVGPGGHQVPPRGSGVESPKPKPGKP